MQRNSFIFYKDWFDIIEKLPKKSQLAIYRAIPRYVFAGERPTDQLASIAFMFIEKQILAQQEKFDETCEKRKAAANKRWNDAKAESEIKKTIDILNTAPKPAPVQKDTLEEEKEVLRKDMQWMESICMRNHIKIEDFHQGIDDFFLDCRARGKLSHNNLMDAKSHFADWLRINIKQQKNNENNRTNNKTKQQRADEYAARLQQLIAEDRVEAMEND